MVTLASIEAKGEIPIKKAEVAGLIPTPLILSHKINFLRISSHIITIQAHKDLSLHSMVRILLLSIR
jgi:hypothetical protein